MNKLLLTACAAVVVLVAGCGSQTPVESDTTRAKAALVRLSDFPAGFHAGAAPSTAKSPCVTVQRAKEQASGRASSATFRLGDTMQAQSSVYVYADEPAAQKAYASMIGSRTASCLGEILARNISAQFGVPAKLRVEPLKLAAMPAERAGTRVRLPFSIETVEVEILSDFLFIRSGRAVAIHTFTSEAAKPFGADLRERLSRTTIERLESELAV